MGLCAIPSRPQPLAWDVADYDVGKIDLKALSFPLTKTDAGGTRQRDLFEIDSNGPLISILRCREIAADPDAYSIPDRRAAYHHLQKAADNGRNRDRGWQDRVLAANLWPRLGELDGEVRR